MSIQNQRKRKFILFLSCIIFLSSIMSSFSITVFADSDKRRAAYISMASSAQTTNFDGVSDLSYDELRIIGVFLSNFYIPFNTQINKTDDDDAVRKDMVSALTESLNFDETLAESLVSTTWGITNSSATRLKIRVKDASGNVVDSSDTCSYYDFTRCFTDAPVSGAKTFELYWGKDNVVFDGNIDGAYTPSTAAMNMIVQSLNLKKGYGSNVLGFDKSADGVSIDSETFENLLMSNTDESLYKASCLKWGLFIDAFGNIIVDCGTRQYILMPACMNPYAWTQDGREAGQALNLVNLYSLTLSSDGKLLVKDSGNVATEPTIQIKYKSSTKGYWRVIRGDTSTDFDLVTNFLNIGEDAGAEFLSKMKEMYNDDKNTLFSDLYEETLGANKLKYYTLNLGSQATLPAIEDFIFFDNWSAFPTTEINNMRLTDYGIFSDASGSSLANDLSSSNSFSGGLKTGEAGFNLLTSNDAKCYLAGIYASYVFAYFEENGVSDGGHVNFRFNKDGLPNVGSGSLDLSFLSLSDDAQTKELKSMVYYFLHPTEGISYVATWFKNKVGGILIGWHQDMVGNTSTSSTTGTTRYIGFSGYVTVPNLHDLEWTDWLLNQYDSLLIYFIILIVIVMLGYVMIGSISLQKAILSIILFAVCSYFPPLMINFMVDTSNNICDSIYGNKFTYWALVQHEQYVSSIASSIERGNDSNYLITLFEESVADSSSTSNAVTLKWMSPKKDNFLKKIQDEMEEATGSLSEAKLLGGLMREQYSGEDYLDKADSLYLYRSYTDISSYASYSYKNLNLGSTYLDKINLSSGKNLNTVFNDYTSDSVTKPNALSLSNSISRGFNFDTNTASGTWTSATNKRFYSALTSNEVSDAIEDGLDSIMVDMASLAGISQSSFNTTIADFNNKNVDQKQSGLFSFGVYTESPFYYFSWNLYDQMDSGSKMATSALSGALYPYMSLFNMTDGAYFYNLSGDEGTSGYGDMRDYMDMRSLFTLIIPYLKSANEVVVDWDNKYGLSMYNEVNLQYNENNDFIIPPEVLNAGKGSELYYKYWHDANVSQLFNMYSPWVDTMYDCDYAKGQYIHVMGEKFFVKDPLDPSSYYETDSQGNITKGRQMIFSESEMKYWGLTKADLTSVEVKILEVEKESYSDLLQLMDYYTFNDDVLNTAAAMIETFNFNKAFSQTGLFKESYIMYPQSYELKNFSYDAYLRLILSGSTGEALQADDNSSIYTRILKNSSITMGLALIVLDMFAVYAIPALKLFFIIAIFFMSILMILSATVKLEINLARVLKESLLAPLIKFLGISVGMAFIVSLFMSNGNTAVTHRADTVISLGDPVMVILVMIIINIVVLVLYYRTVKKVAKDCIKYAKAVGSSVVGMGGGVFSTLASGLLAGKTISSVGGGVVSSGGASVRGAVNGVSAVGHGLGKAGGALVGGAVVAKGIADKNLSLDGRSQKYNDRIERGKEKAENFNKNQQDRKDIAETYNQQAQDKNLSAMDRKIAQGKSKIADANVKIHEKGNAVINNNSVAKSWHSHNEMKQKHYKSSADWSAIRKEAKSDIVQRKGNRAGGKKG